MITLPIPNEEGALGWGTVLADPPWQFGNQGTRASTDNHYPSMTTAEIALLPVDEVAAESAHLYLWTTDAHLVGGDALVVAKAWGFRPVMPLVWVKVNESGNLQMGLGNYYRHCLEICLFCVRGKAPVLAHDELQLFWAPREEHSRKPEVLYEKIEKMSRGPFLEMFARRARSGWTAWGNEAPK